MLGLRLSIDPLPARVGGNSEEIGCVIDVSERTNEKARKQKARYSARRDAATSCNSIHSTSLVPQRQVTVWKKQRRGADTILNYLFLFVCTACSFVLVRGRSWRVAVEFKSLGDEFLACL
jgi:hypothetical protein